MFIRPSVGPLVTQSKLTDLFQTRNGRHLSSICHSSIILEYLG
jgi:hypothetical protein